MGTTQQKSIACAAALVALMPGCAPSESEFDAAAVTAEVETWRAQHEADYRRDWVTIAGLHFLNPGAQTAGSAASSDIVLPPAVPATLGSFVLEGQSVRFEPTAGAAV